MGPPENIIPLMPTVNPQKENGFTPIANEILDVLCRINIPGRERQCLDFIIRKTYGYGKSADRISLSQFATATGLTKRHVRNCLSSLEAKNLISVQPGTFKTAKTYAFNKHHDQWSVHKIVHSAQEHAQGVHKVVHRRVHNVVHHKRKKEILKKGAEKILGEFKNSLPMPEDYHLSDYHIEYANKKGFSLEAIKTMFERFKAHHQAKGNKFKSWRAAWRTWVLNQIEFHGKPNSIEPSLTPEKQIQGFFE